MQATIGRGEPTINGHPKDDIPVRENGLFEPFVYKNDLFTKTGRLGTNIGRASTLKTTTTVLSGDAADKPSAAAGGAGETQ